MFVTLSGMWMEVRLEQPEKAHPPMVVTLFGISIEVNPLHPSNAQFPMPVTLEGILVFLHPTIKVFEAFSIMALQSLLES